MTIFQKLKKQHCLRPIKGKFSNLRSRKIKNDSYLRDVWRYWESSPKFEWPGQPWYVGTGLHYNSKLTGMAIESQICGNRLKHQEYQDTLAFDQPVIPEMLDAFGPFPTVRCKITAILPNSPKTTVDSQRTGWHKDETPYECLRVIIPLSSDPCYWFQLDNQPPINLQLGHAYAFDQSVYHRVFSSANSDNPRVHLILSFVTWFNYRDNTWIPSKFFNQTHPLDLFDLIEL